jgi:hypothetical protein
MTMLQAVAASERSEPGDCEIGDWIASSRMPDWNKKMPVQEYSVPDGSKLRLFIRSLGHADGIVQALWKRVE